MFQVFAPSASFAHPFDSKTITANHQGFLAEGLQRTTAGLGSIIIDSQPITVALLASLFFNERLKPLGYAGLALGVAGLLLLEVPPEALTTGAPSLAGTHAFNVATIVAVDVAINGMAARSRWSTCGSNICVRCVAIASTFVVVNAVPLSPKETHNCVMRTYSTLTT